MNSALTSTEILLSNITRNPPPKGGGGLGGGFLVPAFMITASTQMGGGFGWRIPGQVKFFQKSLIIYSYSSARTSIERINCVQISK